MNNGKRGNLFLLELIVDYVHLDYSQKDFKESETCVTFNFLNNGPIYIRESDFERSSSPENDYTKFGKCCLFSLDPAKMAATYADFNLIISVYKIMYADGKTQMVLAGTTSVPLVHLYQQLIQNSESGKGSGKAMQGNFVLTSTAGEIIGQISLYIRLSCFGRTLVSAVKINVSGDANNLKYVTQEDQSTQKHVFQNFQGFGEPCIFQESDLDGCTQSCNSLNNNGIKHDFSEYLQYYEK